MHTKHAFLLMTLSVFLLNTAFAQRTFYGTVEYTYEITGPEAAMMAMMMPQKMVIQYGKSGMSTSMDGGMMSGMIGRI
ncbi:MAG: hypothetical protein ACO4CH_10950, partial [Saprospiraceae bacterium]